jgi:hypothetical protein
MIRFSLAVTFLLAGSPAVCIAQTSSKLSGDDLQRLVSAASEFCGSFSERSSGTSAVGEADVKATLAPILKKLTDAGLGGKVELKALESKGVPESDRFNDLKDNRSCRITFARILIDGWTRPESANDSRSATAVAASMQCTSIWNHVHIEGGGGDAIVNNVPGTCMTDLTLENNAGRGIVNGR